MASLAGKAGFRGNAFHQSPKERPLIQEDELAVTLKVFGGHSHSSGAGSVLWYEGSIKLLNLPAVKAIHIQ